MVVIGSANPEETDAQVPSPRQYVEAEAPVPEFKLVTGKLPVTIEAKLTDVQVPSPRQTVVAEALVPELRLVTGRFPVTSVVRTT
jgi:hypothetical protein